MGRMNKIDLILWLIVIAAGATLEIRYLFDPNHLWSFTAIVRRWIPVWAQCAVLGVLWVHFPIITLLLKYKIISHP